MGFFGWVFYCQPCLHRVDPVALHVARRGEHGFEGAQAEVVVRLLGQLFETESEEGDDLFGELLGAAEALAEEGHLGDHCHVGRRHGQRSEELLEVVRQVGAAGVSGIHRDEDGHVGVDFDLLAHQLDGEAAVGGGQGGLERLLLDAGGL